MIVDLSFNYLRFRIRNLLMVACFVFFCAGALGQDAVPHKLVGAVKKQDGTAQFPEEGQGQGTVALLRAHVAALEKEIERKDKLIAQQTELIKRLEKKVAGIK